MSRQRVVVLGAAGFLGSALARELALQDVDLRLVARRLGHHPTTENGAVIECVAADLADLSQVDVMVRDADVVFPTLAAIRGPNGWRISADDSSALRIHVDAIERLALAAAAGAVVVFPGSNTQSGATGLINGSESDRPEGVYDRQKLRAERALLAADVAAGIRSTSVRFPPLYGPAPSGSPDRGVVSTMVRRALRSQALTVWGSPDTRRDFLFVDDAARALVAAWRGIERTRGRHWVVGTGSPRSLGTVFDTVACQVARVTGEPPVPVVVVDPPVGSEQLDVKSVEPEPGPFSAATGWRARVPLDEGVGRTVEHLVRAL